MLASEGGGILLFAAAVLALLTANSPLGAAYFWALHRHLGPLTTLHWINDGLMALFFLLIGLEIKRELVAGQLSTWPARILPGLGAAGGMMVPAIIFVFLNQDSPETLRGWAIPIATDIAFALAVLSLLGPRMPASLKIFLTALAVFDDVGAVAIIALFYSGDISLLHLGLVAGALVALVLMNRLDVTRLTAYLLAGILLWFLVLGSGVHATMAGIALAFAIPSRARGDPQPCAPGSALLRLEKGLRKWVLYGVLPIFGFANAGVPLAALLAHGVTNPVTVGVAAGLVIGKCFGVFGAAAIGIASGLAKMPAGARWLQLLGVSALCGIGFTVSLFISSLAFTDPVMLYNAKAGILAGSLLAGLAGWLILRAAVGKPEHGPRQVAPASDDQLLPAPVAPPDPAPAHAQQDEKKAGGDAGGEVKA